jgi:hypothetical protein
MITPMRRICRGRCARAAIGHAAAAPPRSVMNSRRRIIRSFDPAEHRQPFPKRGDDGLNSGIILRRPYQSADSAHGLGLLRSRRERPADRRAAECGDEIPPPKANAHLPLPVPGTTRQK